MCVDARIFDTLRDGDERIRKEMSEVEIRSLMFSYFEICYKCCPRGSWFEYEILCIMKQLKSHKLVIEIQI